MYFFFDIDEKYRKISYKPFLWKLGTTSFRTGEFNKMTEWQLRLLKEFWEKPEYSSYGWEKKYMFPGQNDIYWIKCRYYDWLVENAFMEGGEEENRKFKTAREKTSGLYDMGLINENHRLTDVGLDLLNLSRNREFLEKTSLGISKDSLIYLKQLLKLSDKNTGSTVRPFIVVLYLLSELEYLSYDEFRYLVPLCIDKASTAYILRLIKELRRGKGTIDDILKEVLLSKTNYKVGLRRFVKHAFSGNLLLSVSMNRKSPEKYDRPYIPLYEAMHAVYMQGDTSKIMVLLNTLKNFQSSIAVKWKQMMFDTSNTAKIRKNPIGHLLQLPDEVTESEESFKKFFYLTMHLNKAKATLEDYLDLNRRYLGLTNCFLFDEGLVRLDIVPKQFFGAAITELYKQAYQDSDLLFVNSSLEDICPALRFNEQTVIDGLNRELGTWVTTIEEAYDEVDRIRYCRLNRLIDEKFSDETLLHLLDCFECRSDEAISQAVTDNADIPTIFEYVLGIIWYKISERRGKVLDYLKLSLDANLLPVTHAAGGEADIVYEYSQTEDYPAHNVLLEATLADGTSQRRMEMEPVSRHVGNHILRTGNRHSYGLFVTTFLHANLISDFKSRKNTAWSDSQDFEYYIPGMKIIPIDTNDLRKMITGHIQYKELYRKFENAYQQIEAYPNPKKWYDDLIKMCQG